MFGFYETEIMTNKIESKLNYMCDVEIYPVTIEKMTNPT